MLSTWNKLAVCCMRLTKFSLVPRPSITVIRPGNETNFRNLVNDWELNNQSAARECCGIH